MKRLARPDPPAPRFPLHRLFIPVAIACLVGCTSGCGDPAPYPSRAITLVCPWAAGGGTDRVSRQMAVLLERELQQPVNVINATGGKGVTGHARGLLARPDGYTLTMMTLELSTMHWVGLTELTYRDCIPLMSVNEDYAAVFVRDDSSFQSIDQIEAEIRANPKELTASGTAVGGAWHLALAGWMIAADIDPTDVIWVPSQGSNPSLQQLVSGGVDLVCCSLPEARTLLESGEIRALAVMGHSRAVGFEQVPTLKELGRDCTIGGWRGLGVPQGTPPEVVDRLVAAVRRIVAAEPAEGNFAHFMDTQKFDRTWREADDFRSFLADTDQTFGDLLQSDAMRSVNEDRFPPMAYPSVLIGLIAIVLARLAWTLNRTSGHSEPPIEQPSFAETPRATAGLINLSLVIVAIIAYGLLAETLGFVVTASLILFVLLVRLGTRWTSSLLMTIGVVPATYALFAFVLRVPLPSGWLG